MNSLTKLVCTVLTLVAFTSSASAATLLFDFGRNDRLSDPDTDPAGNTWNNVTNATDDLFVLFEDNGDIHQSGGNSAGFDITDPFYTIGEPSQGGTEAPIGDAADYPVNATDDYLFGHSNMFVGQDPNPTAEFKLNNLDSNNLYDFTFFAARIGPTDNREAVYTVTGNSAPVSVTLEAAGNHSNVVNVNGVSPDGNGEITVFLTGSPDNSNGNGQNFWYIGLMQVDVRVIPEPSSMALLAGSLLASSLFRRRNR